MKSYGQKKKEKFEKNMSVNVIQELFKESLYLI